MSLKHVTIGGMKFAVSWRNKVKSKIQGQKRQLYGMVDHDICAITIATAYDVQHQQVTLLHEALHVILAQARMQLDAGVEEQVIDALDIGLWRMLRDNPDLVRYLLE